MHHHLLLCFMLVLCELKSTILYALHHRLSATRLPVLEDPPLPLRSFGRPLHPSPLAIFWYAFAYHHLS